MSDDLVSLSVELAKAHLMQNRMSHRDVPGFVREIHEVLSQIANSSAASNQSSLATTSTSVSPSEASSKPAEGSSDGPAEASATTMQVQGTQLELMPTTRKTTTSSRIAPVLHQEIDDPVFAGLDPWLAKRITPTIARRLNASNTIHPSVFDDRLICLEDGEPVKLLRSYLRKRFNMDFSEYVHKWNLPDDYPTASPAYLEAKRATARSSGLGVTLRGRRGASKVKAEPAASTAPSVSPKKAPKPAKQRASRIKESAPEVTASAPAARGQRRAAPLMPVS